MSLPTDLTIPDLDRLFASKVKDGGYTFLQSPPGGPYRVRASWPGGHAASIETTRLTVSEDGASVVCRYRDWFAIGGTAMFGLLAVLFILAAAGIATADESGWAVPLVFGGVMVVLAWAMGRGGHKRQVENAGWISNVVFERCRSH